MASYTQAFEEIDDTGWSNGWNLDVNCGSAPANSVAEIIMTNGSTTTPHNYGCRGTDQSTSRFLNLNEAEDGGRTATRFLVNVDASGNIDIYVENAAITAPVYLVGYWEDVTFTEAWDSFTVGSKEDGAWLTDSSFGGNLQASRVHLITITNGDVGKEYLGGVRDTSSSLDRYVDIMEAEGGGVQSTSMYVKSDASSNIDVYAEESTDITFYNQGYFDSAIDFTERMQSSLLASTAWYENDITTYIDQDGRVCDFVIYNNNTASEYNVGVRTGGTSDARYILLRECEGGGVSSCGMSAQTDSNGVIEGYHSQNSTPQSAFALTGYFNVGAAGATEYVQNMTLETITLLDTITSQQTLFREYTETLTLTDTVLKAVSTEIVEISSLTDTITLAPVKNLTEIANLSDGTIERIMAHVELFTETITLTDTIIKDVVHVINELDPLGINLTDTVATIKIFTKTLEDTINLLDTYERVFTIFRTLSETITLVDTVALISTLYKELVETITLVNPAVGAEYTQGATAYEQDMTLEVLTLSDTIQKHIMRTLTELHSLTDTRPMVMRKATGESITLLDTYSEIFTIFRTLSEIAGLTDTKTRDTVKAVSDSITLIDSVTRLSTLYETLSEIATLTDTYEEVFGVLRTFDETITLIDTVAPLIVKIVNLTDILSVDDTLARDFTILRTLSEIATLTDTYAEVFGVYRTFSETPTFSDSVLVYPRKNLTETIDLIDTVARLSTLYETLSEISTLTDTEINAVAIVKSNIITLTDSLVTLEATIVTLNETITMTDTMIAAVVKIISNSMTLNDTMLDEVTWYRTFSDSYTLTDTEYALALLTPSELITLTDTKISKVFKVFADSTTLNDAIDSLSSKTFSDTITLVDVDQINMIKLASETLNVEDTFARLFTVYRTLSETITLIDTIVTSYTGTGTEYTSTLTETMTLLDTDSFEFTAFRIFTDSITLVDTYADVLSLYETLSDSVSLDDSYVFLKTFYRTLSDTITFADTVTVTKTLYKLFTETMSLDDSVLRMPMIMLIDSMTLSDSYIRSYIGKIIATTRFLRLVREDLVLKIVKHRKV
jgi:hypothetical protein